jgi:hypothetical protein
MEKEILHKYAEDSNGKIIHIDIAETGESYICPSCKDKFTYKNGKIRQRHFAHNNPSTNCTSEGYLHKTFKKMLLELIKEKISQKLPIEVIFNCVLCKQTHKFNLLQGIIDVKDEYSMNVCRPDIALIHNEKIIPVVIEIIVTHEIEDKAIAYYIQNRIIVIRIKLESLSDLETIEYKIRNPTDVYPFNKSICQTYINILNQERQNQLLMNQGLLVHPTFIPNTGIQTRRGTRMDEIDARLERQNNYSRNNYRKGGYSNKYRKK